MIKNACNLSMKKHNSFILNYRGVGEEVWGKGSDKNLNKWNWGNMSLTKYQ